MQTITFLEFQAFVQGENAGRVFTIDDDKRTIRTGEHADEDIMSVLSAFHSKAALAAISSCDIHTIKAVDYLGNVWNDCDVTFNHIHSNDENA